MSRSPAALSPPTSLREKLAQLMMVRIGSNLPPVRTVEQDAERIAALLGDCPVGGLIVFNGRRDQTPATLADLQSQSSQPLLVAADIERGVGQQLHGSALFPHAMAFAALVDDAMQAVEAFSQLTAREARECGLHIAFAPVADVNVDPRNPIIATRAFGDDPQQVADLVSAFVRGCRSGGLLSAAKHFPGHGNTHEDSHHALPTVVASRAAMEQCELVPFRAAIEAGVPLIMTAHVRYPEFDRQGAPATLSHPILHDLLRQQLGFEGAVVSDSLLMEGVKSQAAGEGELAVAALLAGIDILLDVAEPMTTLTALEMAVNKGDLPVQRVDDAFARLWQLKQTAFASREPAGPTNAPQQIEEFAEQIAAQSIRCLPNHCQLLPFATTKDVCGVLVRPYQSHLDPPEQPLGAALRAIAPAAAYCELGPQSEPQEFEHALALAAAAEQVVLAIIVKPAAWHHFGLLPEQVEFVKRLTAQQPCVVASLGTPEALQTVGSTALQLCTFSDVPVSQRALAEYLFAER